MTTHTGDAISQLERAAVFTTIPGQPLASRHIAAAQVHAHLAIAEQLGRIADHLTNPPRIVEGAELDEDKVSDEGEQSEGCLSPAGLVEVMLRHRAHLAGPAGVAAMIVRGWDWSSVVEWFGSSTALAGRDLIDQAAPTGDRKARGA